MQYYFTREIKTRRFEAVAGMPVPAKYSSKKSIRFLKEAYGDDIVRAIDYTDNNDFAKLIAGDGPARDQFEKLRCAYEEQSAQLRETKAELKRIKGELAKLKPQA